MSRSTGSIFGTRFPALGLRGAAIATLAARIAETTAILYYVVFVTRSCACA
jgi:Na+-driven multidrug efflux pump